MGQYIQKIGGLLFVALFIVLLIFPAPANAQKINLQAGNYPEIPTPAGPIDLNCLEVGLCNFSIALVILLVYSISIWVAGLLAFIMLMYTGFTYIAGGASPGARRKAKRMFQNVLWGLAILLLSNALLTTINDNILQLEDPNVFNIEATAPVYEAQRLQGEGIDFSSGNTSTFSCTYVSASEGDTSSFSCVYTNGKCLPEGGNACEAGYAEGVCSSYNDQANAQLLCNSVPKLECPANPDAESGCVPVGGDACQAGYTEDFCSTYDDKELECNSLPQLECPADTGGGGGGGGGGGNIAEIYDACTTGAECETKYGSNYTCDRSRSVCIGKYEECVYNTDKDSDLAVCWDFLLGGGSNYDKERPGCGTDYSPNCHTLVAIKQNVRTELDKEFASDPAAADRFFDSVIPNETGGTWNPASEAKNGVNCTPVGLYQLEDKTRMNPGGSCPEGTHKDEDYEIETAHAADVYFNRGCGYWAGGRACP